MDRPVVLIKVGGSLCDAAVLRGLAPVFGRLAPYWRAVLLPGGGPFADAVRGQHSRLDLPEDISHQMALLAMEQYGWVLHRFVAQSRLIEHSDEAELAWRQGLLPIFQPAGDLRDIPETELPRNWQVTSDTIAAYLAVQFGARQVLLLKSRDPASVSRSPLRSGSGAGSHSVSGSIEAAELARRQDGLVDPFFSVYLQRYGLEGWLLNGHRPRDLLVLAQGGTPPGLRVIGSITS